MCMHTLVEFTYSDYEHDCHGNLGLLVFLGTIIFQSGMTVQHTSLDTGCLFLYSPSRGSHTALIMFCQERFLDNRPLTEVISDEALVNGRWIIP